MVVPHGLKKSLEYIQLFEGSHPWPDEHSESAAMEISDFAEKIPRGSTVFCLISGGASALMETPAGSITLDELHEVYKKLLKSGAGIHEMNVVRKHLSKVKGGKLLKKLAGCRVINLLISDVPGDNPGIIGSAPTIPDKSMPDDATKVLKEYGLYDQLPDSVRYHLQSNQIVMSRKKQDQENQLPESELHTYLTGTAFRFAKTAAKFAAEAGFEAVVPKVSYDEPAEDLVKRISSDVSGSLTEKKALIYHGESMVKVSGDGKGGRNQHVALLLAFELEGKENVLALSAGTDGRDGPTIAAGAVADGTTIERARKAGLDPEDFRDRFDSWHFFKSLDDLIFTGQTGNNLMDFQMVLINR